MKDLLDGVDPRSMMDGGKSLRPETRINIVAAKAEHGFKNYAEAKTWAKEHIARTYSGKETGGRGIFVLAMRPLTSICRKVLLIRVTARTFICRC